MVKVRFFYWISILLFTLNVNSQVIKSLDSLLPVKIIDSLFIDHDLENYSIRLMTNFKSQAFRFSDGTNKLNYTPNNRGGYGIGFASNKISFDFSFSLNFKDEQKTDRFDIRLSYQHKDHFFDVFFQQYKGFEFSNESGDFLNFRDDLVSITNGINYLYIFNKNNYRSRALRSIISQGSKTNFSYGLGAFGFTITQKGEDAFLIPGMFSNNQNRDINRIFGIGSGVLSGVNGFFKLDDNWYASATANLGVGLMYRELRDVSLNQNTTYSEVYQVYTSGVLGYVKEKYYVNVSMGLGYFNNEIIPDINQILNLVQAKFAVGYKFFKK